MKLENKHLLKLLASDVEPKISIILPIHPETPQVENNILTYKNLLKDVKKDLELNYHRREWEETIEKLKALILDRTLWNNAKQSLLIFANSEGMEICEVKHEVAAKEHVGSTFLVQDLLLPEENFEKANYIINISRDRINVFDSQTLQEVKLEGVHQRFSDYYSDFDANSNLNSGAYGGMSPTYHGHRSKSEEQQKDQSIYYQYLDNELTLLKRGMGYTFVIAGLPEVLDVYLKSYENRAYINGVIHGSILNLSHKELSERISEFCSFEKIAQVDKIKRAVEKADAENRVINDMDTINFALINHDVRSIVSFSDVDSYSIEHNKLMIQSLIHKISCRVLYTTSNGLPSMNAILY